MPLTAKKERFVSEYLVDLNAAAAAIRAGYSPRGAKECGWRLLREPAVAAEVARGQAARSRKTGISADRVLRELGRVAFAEGGDLPTLDDTAPPEVGREMQPKATDEFSVLSCCWSTWALLNLPQVTEPAASI